jgi:hypothetical protein
VSLKGISALPAQACHSMSQSTSRQIVKSAILYAMIHGSAVAITCLVVDRSAAITAISTRMPLRVAPTLRPGRERRGQETSIRLVESGPVPLQLGQVDSAVYDIFQVEASTEEDCSDVLHGLNGLFFDRRSHDGACHWIVGTNFVDEQQLVRGDAL